MDDEATSSRVKWIFAGMFFLLGMAPGFYIPVITNVLAARELGSEWVERVFLCAPLAALISPVAVGALADNRFSAQRVYGVISLASGVLMAVAFTLLDRGASPWWFVGFFFAGAVSGGPMWSMLSSLSMVHMRHPAREFPLVRLGGTLGWIIAGLLLSWVLAADDSVLSGYMAAGVKVAGGILAFRLPDTPAPGGARSWRSLLGLDAFRLMREADHRSFFVCAALLSIPLSAFFMHAPAHLDDLGTRRVAATMSIGQLSEVLAMLAMAAILGRFRVKVVLLWAFALSVLRYVLFALAGWTGSAAWLVTGISLHGLAYTLFFITGQLFLQRRVAPEMRSQAQGMLSLFSNGIGALFGVVAVRHFNDWMLESGAGWGGYWAVLAGVTLVVTVGFAVTYRGLAAAP